MSTPQQPFRFIRAVVDGRAVLLRPLKDTGVRGTPSAVTGLVVTQDDTARSATISWAPPASFGGSPITGYRVARDGIDASGDPPYAETVASAVRTFTFTDLAPGTTYTLTVQAGNAQGLGPAVSRPVTIVVDTTPVPSIPTALVVTKDDNANSVTISWGPPVTDNGSPVVGYRVARDGVDAAGLGAYSTQVAADVRTFTFTRLVGGATYRPTVQAVNVNGVGPAAGAPITLAADPTGGVQKTGAGYVLVQDLPAGDLHTKLAATNGNLKLSLEGKTYTESDFDRAYGSTAGRGYWSAAVIPTDVSGMVGASMASTVIQLAPNSSTLNLSTQVNPFGLGGSPYTNDIYILASVNNPNNLEFADFTVRGSAQHPTTSNNMQGHDYNGFSVSSPQGNVTMRNITVENTPGSASSPPGETFMLNVYRLLAGKRALIEGCRILGGKVGSAGLGLNRMDGLVDVNNLVGENTRYSAVIAMWRIGAGSVVNIRNSRMFGMRRTLGSEAIAGQVNVYDPVWGDVQNSRFDINLTWALLANGVIYKNGKINFYFSSDAAWQRFKDARGKFVHSPNAGRQGMIRVVTNTKEDYGYGLVPSGTFEDPRKCVRIYFLNPTTGAYVQRPTADYVDFFGVNVLTY